MQPQEDDAQAEALHKKYVRSGSESKSASGSLGTLGDALRQQMQKKNKR